MRLVLLRIFDKLAREIKYSSLPSLLFFLLWALVSTGSILSALRGRPDNARSSSDACGS